ncbi:MAG TPA: ATP-binding protein, partial [Gammaproteobacteria bacterium]
LLALSADRIAALPAPAVAAPAAPLAGPPAVTCWSWTLKLGPEVLRRTNVIPVVLNQIRELQDEASLPPALFTVLTELFSNALEHGLLGLNSHSKDDADGFARYYMEREARLAQLQDGRISIGLEALPNGDLRLELEDSGPGFDHAALAARAAPDNDRYYSGRGIALVRALCRELNYSEGGKRVVAVFPGGS